MAAPTVRSVATAALVDSAPVVVAKPAGVVSGDLLVAINTSTADGAASALTGSTGWTQVGALYNTGTTAGMNGVVWYKIAGSSEPTSYSFAGTGVSDGNAVAIVAITAGTYNATTPFDVNPTWSGSDATVQTAQVAPSISPSVSDALLLTAWSQRCFNNVASYTPPGTMTEIADFQATGNYSSTAVARQALTASGATGTRTATSSRASNYAAVSLAIKSAPSNVAPTANAGADQTVTAGATVTLTGTDSDSDGTVVSRAWTQTSGAAVTLSGASTATATYTAPAAGTSQTFTYTVTDNGGLTGSDSITVQSVPASTAPLGPGAVDISTTGTVRTATTAATLTTALAASVAGDTVSCTGNFGNVTISRSISSGYIRVVPSSAGAATFGRVDLTGAQGLDLRGLNTTGEVYYSGTSRIFWRGGKSNVTSGSTGDVGHNIRESCADVVIEDATINNAGCSFYLYADRDSLASTRVTIQRCRSNNVWQDHVFIGRGTFVTIEANECYGHVDTTEHQDGVQIVGGKDVTIRRNHFWNPRTLRQTAADRNDHGVIINYDPAEVGAAGTAGRKPERITVENNLIHDMTSYGIAIAGVLGVTLTNNTVVDNGLNGLDRALSVAPDAGNTINGMVVVNNIFSTALVSGATITLYANNHVVDGSGPTGTATTTGTLAFGSDYGLLSTGTAVASGLTSGAPTLDIYGRTRHNPPTRGAVEFFPDVVPPSPPTTPSSIIALLGGPTSVTINWVASTDDQGVASYRVLRNGASLLGGEAVTDTSFTDTSVRPGTTYSYTVSAMDAEGNRSAESAPTVVTTPTPPLIPTAATWTAWARSSALVLTTPLPIDSIQANVKHLGLGKAVLTTGYTTERWDALAPSSGIVLNRDGRQVFSGPVRSRRLTWDADSGVATIRIEAAGDELPLAVRVACPDPLRATADQTVNDYWTFTGKASAAMRKLIDDQAITCHVERKVTGLVLGGSDPNVGVSATWTGLFDNVLDLLTSIANASGADLGLRMTAAAGVLTATVVMPTDRTGTVIFSADLSNVGGTTFTESAPTTTNALVAGQGDLHLRTRRQAVSTDPTVTRWGQPAWTYVDRRDTNDTAKLDQAGADTLIKGQGDVALALTLMSTEAATYGTDWDLGDKVTAYVGLPDQPKVAVVEDVIREVAFTVSADGRESIQPAIGSVGARVYLPTPQQRELSTVAQRAAALVRNK